MTSYSSQNVSKKPPVTVFLAATIFIFFCMLSALESVGLVPDYIDGTTPAQADTTSASDASNPTAVSQLASIPYYSSDPSATTDTLPTTPTAHSSAISSGITPVHISIPAGNIDLPVQNPATTDVDALDALLKHGPAHFSRSADLGENGTVIIFAHSSHLPLVINKMFQAFNNIPKLKAGDSITITGSDGQNYLYSVESVAKATVNDGTTIDISGNQGSKLVLVTCDTLTGVSARFVLTADFVGVSGSTNTQ